MAHNKDNVILLRNFCLEADVSAEYDELLWFLYSYRRKKFMPGNNSSILLARLDAEGNRVVNHIPTKTRAIVCGPWLTISCPLVSRYIEIELFQFPSNLLELPFRGDSVSSLCALIANGSELAGFTSWLTFVRCSLAFLRCTGAIYTTN